MNILDNVIKPQSKSYISIKTIQLIILIIFIYAHYIYNIIKELCFIYSCFLYFSISYIIVIVVLKCIVLVSIVLLKLFFIPSKGFCYLEKNQFFVIVRYYFILPYLCKHLKPNIITVTIICI